MSLITYFMFNLACMFDKNLAHHHIKEKNFEKKVFFIKSKKRGSIPFQNKIKVVNIVIYIT